MGNKKTRKAVQEATNKSSNELKYLKAILKAEATVDQLRTAIAA